MKAKTDSPRCITRSTLKPWARRVPLRAAWRTLGVPAAQVKALRQTAAALRDSSRSGERVLLTGGDSVARAQAAQVLARELKLPLYRVDLSAVVGKYIGETEKNLDRLFSEAASAEVMLLFDEAEALFGKRSETRDAHDRYATLETAYLLQRLKQHDGRVLFAVSRKSDLDGAFRRRLRCTVELSLPAATLRR